MLLTKSRGCNGVGIHLLIASFLMTLPVGHRLGQKGAFNSVAASDFMHALYNTRLQAFTTGGGALQTQNDHKKCNNALYITVHEQHLTFCFNEKVAGAWL